MKKFTWLLLLVGFASSALAVGPAEVELRASTVAGSVVGGVGDLDTTLPDRLVFRNAHQPDLVMPYAQISEFSSRQEVAHHLGVLAAIAVGLLMARQHHHFISIAYTDGNGAIQVATFEVGKQLPEMLLPVLRARARNACERREYGACLPVVPLPRKPLAP